MKRMTWLAVGIIAGLVSLGTWGWAAVSGQAVTVSARPGSQFYIPLILTADEAVAGVNGELTYDAAKFSAPELSASSYASGFVTLGNSPQPGKFRFVIYADPTALLTLGPPLIYVRLTAANVAPSQPSETISYTIAAASSPEGVSLSSVTFNDVTVQMLETGVKNWAIYQ